MTIEKLPDTNDDKPKPQRSPDELRKALQVCETQRRDARAAKKAINGTYNDQLKDLEKEINDILQQLEKQGAKVQ